MIPTGAVDEAVIALVGAQSELDRLRMDRAMAGYRGETHGPPGLIEAYEKRRADAGRAVIQTIEEVIRRELSKPGCFP